MLSQLDRPFANVVSDSLVRSAEQLLQGVARGNSVIMQHELLRDETWYWLEPWRSMEQEVDEHVRRGEVSVFESIEEFLADLDE